MGLVKDASPELKKIYSTFTAKKNCLIMWSSMSYLSVIDEVTPVRSYGDKLESYFYPALFFTICFYIHCLKSYDLAMYNVAPCNSLQGAVVKLMPDTAG